MERISELFLNICNMSVTAGIVILLVILVRGILYRSPKVFSYCLWGIVGFRLVCPYSFTTMFSMFNMEFFRKTNSTGNSMTWIPQTAGRISGKGGIALADSVTAGVGNGVPQSAGNEMAKAAEHVVQKSEGLLSDGDSFSKTVQQGIRNITEHKYFLQIAAFIWIMGIVIFLIYQGIAYWKLKRKTAMAVQSGKGIYECDSIRVPFVMGIVRPRIYLPFRINEKEREYILAHEKYHIRRHDHQVKFAATLILAVYWFHPLVWTAYHLMCKDMEMSCDEKVIQMMGSRVKADYSRSLLGFAVNQRIPAASPLAFGEISVKARIKNVLTAQNHGKMAVVASVIICLMAGVIGCGNALRENYIQNLSAQESSAEDGIKYHYEVGNDFQSFLIYKEVYGMGDLEEYKVLRSGTFGEEIKRSGEFTVMRKYWHSNNETWDASMSWIFSGEEPEEWDNNELLQRGYRAMAETYYLKNTKEHEKIKAEDDIVAAAWHLARDNGEVEAFPCQSYMDEEYRRAALNKNAGEILYHIVFSKKTEEELLEEYKISPFAKRLYAAKNSYIGDAPKNGELIKELMVPSMGDFSMELQTKEEPYGLILNFDKEPADEVEFYQRMLKKSAEFLMLTENAGSVEWTYPVQNAGKEETRRFICDVDMLERMSGIENIKQYAGSKKAVQEFLTEHLADVRVHYENIGVLLEKFQSPVGKLYQMSSYVVGREEGAEFDRVYSVLMNASTVTMEDVQEAIDAGGATDKIYVVKEVDAANENDFIIEGYQAPDGKIYQYKSVIRGRHPNAETNSAYLVYSNRSNVKFADITEYLFGSTMPKEEMYVLILDETEYVEEQ